jgi:hypothetical protein
VKVTEYRKRRRTFDGEIGKMAEELRHDRYQWQVAYDIAVDRLGAHRAKLESLPEGNEFALREYICIEHRLENELTFAEGELAALHDQLLQIGQVERLVGRYLTF